MAHEELKKLFPHEGHMCLKSCGKCCVAGAPIELEEANDLLKWLQENITFEQLKEQFQYSDDNPEACPFLKPDKGCFVYPARPVVCVMFGHLSDSPGMPKAISQKCPEGVKFTEVPFDIYAEPVRDWFISAVNRSGKIAKLRFIEVDDDSGFSGRIPFKPGSFMERISKAKSCDTCGSQPSEGNPLNVIGRQILCGECYSKLNKKQ